MGHGRLAYTNLYGSWGQKAMMGSDRCMGLTQGQNNGFVLESTLVMVLLLFRTIFCFWLLRIKHILLSINFILYVLPFSHEKMAAVTFRDASDYMFWKKQTRMFVKKNRLWRTGGTFALNSEQQVFSIKLFLMCHWLADVQMSYHLLGTGLISCRWC